MPSSPGIKLVLAVAPQPAMFDRCKGRRACDECKDVGVGRTLYLTTRLSLSAPEYDAKSEWTKLPTSDT